MTKLVRLTTIMLLTGLGGCVLPPPLPLPPPPLVALPGPGKTEAQFQADDGACRAEADRAPPSETITLSQPTNPPTGAPAPTAMQPTVQMTPGMIYLRCMVAHQNVVQPLAPVHPVYYGFYPAYPIYYGFGDSYPWLYGGPFGFGFYGGGFYGRGFHGGGFREGGFHEGGFRGGGGREGGFRGGGRR